MSLGYETYEDNRSFEQKGLTGSVKRFTTDKMEYPCFIIQSTDDNPVKLFKMQTLQRMFATTKVYDESLTDSLIYLYFSTAGKIAKVGSIRPSQVKPILSLFEGNNVIGFLDKDTQLEGMHLYVLAE